MHGSVPAIKSFDFEFTVSLVYLNTILEQRGHDVNFAMFVFNVGDCVFFFLDARLMWYGTVVTP